MVAYRRNFVKGGTYFFTVTLADRRKTTLTDHIHLLGDAFRKTKLTHPFETIAAVVLPDHLHTIWTIPENDADYSTRWRLIKSRFTVAIRDATPRNEPIWQSRFWEHTVRDERDLQAHVDYIHFNPVKHGFSTRPSEWPHSTLHAFIKRGECSSDWADDPQGKILVND